MQLIHQNFILSIINSKIKTSADFSNLKKKFYSQNKSPQPTNADLREEYERMIKQRKIKRNTELEKAMQSRGVRTASGVAVVAVLTRPSDCPGKCLYCPTEKDMPKSYLSNEPAVMRAIANKFNPYRQVQSRLKALELNGHITDKIELIVMGGTFSYFPKAYQKKFITECFRAANEYSVGKNNELRIKNQEKDTPNNKLFKEQKRNEKTKHRIIGLTLETRPDYIDAKEIKNFRLLGCTRVELGVQSIFDDVLELNKRGHSISETIRATKLLKDAGFKINYHIMPGLLGSTIKRDIEMFRQLFTDQDFQPDMLKIYPTVVIKDSELYAVWKKGDYKPLTDKKFEKLIIEIKNKIIPPYVRIARLVRDVPTPSIEAGPIVSNMRQIVAEKAACRCIRCREVRADYDITENIILDRIDYDASGGKEIFLQFVSEDKNKLFALLRLRLPRTTPPHSRGGGWEGVHIGLGKKLIQEAEKIARKEFGAKKIAIISGIGVRGYYRKQGYRLQNTYMVKNLK
ncbi:MAG: elongator complex protein 3 [Parcubacteria group bacterium Athens0714_25]|nr:MAG: elongator complex protein 3 [Parcubacteria group bacterium Athens0714_25]